MGSWKHGSCPPNLLSRWCFWSGCISSNHPASQLGQTRVHGSIFSHEKNPRRKIEVTISTLTVLPITLGPSLAGGVRQGSDIQYESVWYFPGSDGGNIITSTVKTDTLDRQTIETTTRWESNMFWICSSLRRFFLLVLFHWVGQTSSETPNGVYVWMSLEQKKSCWILWGKPQLNHSTMMIGHVKHP